MYHLAPPDRYQKRARTIVVLLLAGFVACDVVVAVAAPEEIRGRLGLQLALNTMWNAVFLGGIWHRQNWARYVLCFFLLLSIVFGAAVALPQAQTAAGATTPALVFLLLFHLAALGVVAFNPTIRKFVHSR